MVVPDGIAHYLEHKLFEDEDGDSFQKFAKTGASANAYTSFDVTAYLFQCTENFFDSFDILLDFVQTPYFTEQGVKKEHGIIAQEIKMYDDDPDWRVEINLLAMYQKHPVRVDIAGSVESISNITAQNLLMCYENFYNLNNMSLCVVGDLDKDKVLAAIERKIKMLPPVEPERIFPDEPCEILNNRVEQEFDVTMPSFKLGFKERAGQERVPLKKSCFNRYNFGDFCL